MDADRCSFVHTYALEHLENTLQMCVFKIAHPTCCHCPYAAPYNLNVISAVFPVRRLICQIRDCLIADRYV